MKRWRGPTNARGLPLHRFDEHTDTAHAHETTATGGRLSPLAWMGGPATDMKSNWDLAFWEARSETTSYAHGDSVGTITDTSAAASNWTAAGGARGLWKSTGASGATLPNGYPFVRLDGTDDFYERAADISSVDLTVVMVVRNYGGGTGYRMLWTTDKHLLSKSMTANEWGVYWGADVSYGAALSSAWNVIVWRIRDSGSNPLDLSAQGLMLTPTSTYADQGKTVTSLGSNNGAAQYADVDVAAFAIASSALSNDAVAELVTYWRNTYCT